MLLVCLFTLQTAVCVQAKPQEISIPPACMEIMESINITNTCSLIFFTLSSVVTIVISMGTLLKIHNTNDSGLIIAKVIFLAVVVLAGTYYLWSSGIPQGMATFSAELQIEVFRAKNQQEICNTNKVLAQQSPGYCPSEAKLKSLCTSYVKYGVCAMRFFHVIAQAIVLVVGHDLLQRIFN